ncbi:MAG TPA: S41 family peptidase, partial [Planctomycetia bacterium]|nr:S41 family peptidase [Planctomycetia bacterium]
MLSRSILAISTAALFAEICLAAPIDVDDSARRSAEIVKIVREHFFDPVVAEEWAKRNANYATGLPADQFAAATRKALAELKVSHTGFFTEDDAKYHGLRAIFAQPLKLEKVEWESPGADFTQEGFVRRTFAGGPAEAAGLLRGDKVLQADGASFAPVASFRGKAGKEVALLVERREGEKALTVKVTPRRINPKQEWLEAQRKGARVIKSDGKRVAYVPMFSCAGSEHQELLEELIAQPTFREAEALIIDFRDGFGGANPQFVNLFNKTPPVIDSKDRDGKQVIYDPQWRKPVAFLINGGTTSGKEVVAFAIRKHGIGKLIGKPTAGAVLGGRCFPLAGDCLMYLAV